MGVGVRRKHKMFTHVRVTCFYCERDHAWVCNCGHKHTEHTLFGGCTQCDCDRYDQSGRRMFGETQEDFEKRTLRKRR